VPDSLREPLSPASFLMIANGCSNETNAHCGLPHLFTKSTKLTKAEGMAFDVIERR